MYDHIDGLRELLFQQCFKNERYAIKIASLTLGIVSLLFCGITLKHYAYHNMSQKTRIGTKHIFQVLAQLSENFIFIYLGLSLFTMTELVFKPTIIVITTVSFLTMALIVARHLCSSMVCSIPDIVSHQYCIPPSPTKSRCRAG